MIDNLTLSFYWGFDGALFLKRVSLCVESIASCSVYVDDTSHYRQCENDTHEWLFAYMQGKKPPQLPVHFPESAFQTKVLKALMDIEFGKTVSYSELASTICQPTAVRACASACAKNPWPLVIPCHRVIGKDGALHGFNQGIAVKQALLQFESARV